MFHPEQDRACQLEFLTKTETCVSQQRFTADAVSYDMLSPG
jgi:hypothetical protein